LPEVATIDQSTVLVDWDIAIDVDTVLSNQGIDPQVARQHRPLLVTLAERALIEGLPLLDTAAVYRTLRVEAVRHERVTLEGGGTLTGRLIAQHLAPAEQVAVLAATIGERLDERVSEKFAIDPAYVLALDGLGSAAVEALAIAACNHIEAQAAANGLQTTIPLSPGMVGWPVDIGQQQIFSLLDADLAGIRLTSGAQMIPRKSLSMVMGIGREVSTAGRTCDFCSMRETCRYQDHYTR
jgi:hypothetical protein